MEIRPERPEDCDAIARVVGDAFGGDVEVRLVEAIRASENHVAEFALVAVDDDEVVGHVMLSYVTLADDDATHRILSLSPLAVAPSRQRAGVGSALVREALARAEASGEPLVVLEGSPDYYGRLGFEHSVKCGIHIDLPSWAPPEAAQMARLRAYDPAIRGRVVYPPAFDEATH